MLTKRLKLKKILKIFFQRISGSPHIKYPVFIFGEQRSGTNMLINTLNKSMDTNCYFETDDEAFDNYQLKNTDVIETLVNKSYASCVIFKSISDSQNASLLLDRFLGAKGIWIYRSYSDVINSSLRNFKEHYKFLELIIKDPEKAAWRAENVSQKNMVMIKKYYDLNISDASSRGLIWFLRNDLYFQQKLDQDHRVLLVKYEDLVLEPLRAFKSIFNFLEIDFKVKFIREISSSSISKNAKTEIDDEIEKMCSNHLYRLNFIKESNHN